MVRSLRDHKDRLVLAIDEKELSKEKSRLCTICQVGGREIVSPWLGLDKWSVVSEEKIMP